MKVLISTCMLILCCKDTLVRMNFTFEYYLSESLKVSDIKCTFDIKRNFLAKNVVKYKRLCALQPAVHTASYRMNGPQER